MSLQDIVKTGALVSITMVVLACGGARTAADPPAAEPDTGPDQGGDQAAAPADQTAAPADQGQPDYQPKTSPDTVADYAPAISAKVDALAPADIEGLPELIFALEEANKNAAANPGSFREGNVILGADPQEYVPSDEELFASEIGDRIAAIVAQSNIGQLEFALKSRGIKAIKVSYGKIRVRHVDVMGSGRFFYAAAPKATVVQLLPQKN
jgi:hypothetical protein